MTTKEFEKEIQKLDPRLTIAPNTSRPKNDENKIGLNNIFFEGKNYDLPVVPDVVKDTIDPGYRYMFPHGASVRMWSQNEIIDRLKSFLKQFGTGELDELYNEK